MDIKRMLIKDGAILRGQKMVAAEPAVMEKGVYTIQFDPMGLFFEKERSIFTEHNKIYNPLNKHYNRFKAALKKWHDNAFPSHSDYDDPMHKVRGFSLVATAMPGTGKSQLAELLCNIVVKRGGVVIYVSINNPIDYEGLAEALRFLGNREVMVYFDEIDRTYRINPADVERFGSHHAQDRILQFFSDDDFAHVHRIVTSNGNNLSDALMNRPQRLMYRLNDHNLSLESKDYAEIVKDHGITGEAASYLIQALDNSRMTADETINIAYLCKGLDDPWEMVEEVDVLNTRRMSSNFHELNPRDRGDINYPMRVVVTYNADDADERYRVRAYDLKEDDPKLIYDELHPYFADTQSTIVIDGIEFIAALSLTQPLSGKRRDYRAVVNLHPHRGHPQPQVGVPQQPGFPNTQHPPVMHAQQPHMGYSSDPYG